MKLTALPPAPRRSSGFSPAALKNGKKNGLKPGRILALGFLLLAALPPTSHAAEALAKLIPPPANAPDDSNFFAQSLRYQESAVRALITVTTGTPSLEKPNASLPGYRTATAGNFAFVAGWMDRGNSVDDSFLSKVDAAGSVVWTKAMTEILKDTGRLWLINDIETAGDRIYVCGQNSSNVAFANANGTATDSQGFVARLNLDGGIEDYTLFEVPKSSPGKAGQARAGQVRACSLSISTVKDVRLITVIGDAQSNDPYTENSNLVADFAIDQRKLTGGTMLDTRLPLYNGANVGYNFRGKDAARYGNRDIFVVRLTENLQTHWATTLGYLGDDFATAVASDDTGAIFLGVITHPNADDYNSAGLPPPFNTEGGGTNPIDEFDNPLGTTVRTVYQASTGTGSPLTNANFLAWDRYPDAAAFIWRMDTTANVLTHSFMTTSGFFPTDQGRAARVTDLVYQGGSLYAAGEFKGGMRPRSDARVTVPAATGLPLPESFELKSPDNGYDIWTARLTPSNLISQEWRFFRSDKDDFVTELTAADDGVYLAGYAGGTLNTFVNYHKTPVGVGVELKPDDASAIKTTSGGASSSSAPHTFWQKLGSTTLSNDWHILPVEASGITIPAQSQLAGIAQVGSNILLTGGWTSGSITLGPTSSRKTLSLDFFNAFVGFVKPNGTWLEELAFTINSEFGRPTPHKGRDSVAAGTPVTAQVPPEIFEDAAGQIIDSTDQAGITSRAVVKRVCTGYQFANNALNGTSNSVSFIANADTTLTFNWRTEYAIQIESDLSGTDGLTSTAAGSPTPEVNKHWLRENEPFTAFIDGEASQASQAGVRWRSTGYEAYGSVASTAGIGTGFRPWSSFQPRQQTPIITVTGPGRIVWKWEKEHSLRVATNSIVAATAPITSSRVKPTPFFSLFFEVGYQSWFFQPTEVTRLRIRTNADFNPASVPFIVLAYADNNNFSLVSTAGYQPSSTYTISREATGRKDTVFRVLGFNGTAIVNPQLSFVEILDSTDAVSVSVSGSGEHWFPVGASVTVSSPASFVSGGRALGLKGFTNGTGSVIPFDEPNITTKTFFLNEPSTITWDYARAIYKENVTVGSAITFSAVTAPDDENVNSDKAPSGGTVSIGPADSGWGDMQAWDEVAKKLYVLRPGKFTVEFENKQAPTDATQNVIVEVTATWPANANYTHIMETPPVPLESAEAPNRQFVRVAYTEGNASAVDSQFQARERGRSVLLFSERAVGTATGNLTLERLIPQVVSTVSWSEVIRENAPAEIGIAMSSGAHNSAAVGHNGYVINDTAPVNPAIYARNSRQGPVIAVNRFDSDPANPPQPPLNSSSVVTNGGFETGTVSQFPGSLSQNGNIDISGWSTNDKSRVGLNRVGGINPFLTSLPPQGNQLAFIQSLGPPVWLQQAFTGLVTGKRYLATLRVNARVGTPNAEMRVEYNGVQITALSVVPTTGSFYTIWVPFTAGGANTLRITNQTPADSTLLIDDLTIANYEVPVAMAWYRVQDGLRWPYQSAIYRPVWPASPNRIVMASQLGSEGLGTTQNDEAGGAITLSDALTASSPRWQRPSDDGLTINPGLVQYKALPTVPKADNNNLWVRTNGWAGRAFVYEGDFDPLQPGKNLVASIAIGNPWTQYGFLRNNRFYTIVVSQADPAAGRGDFEIDLQGGAQIGGQQPLFSGATFSDLAIYHQADPTQMGYNPNEEHALLAPSFLEGTRSAAFALHHDLNVTALAAGYTSDPYVLVQHMDRTDPGAPVAKMLVYAVSEQDALTTDTRLPVYNQKYTFLYQGTAGQKLFPPHPLTTVIGPGVWPQETTAENVDNRIAYFEDKKRNAWIVSGDTDPAEDIRAVFYYPMRAEWWHPTAVAGESVVYAKPATPSSRNILYNTIWPADVAVLKAGETLTFSGGEYASDNNSATPRPKGLPQAVAWQSARVEFDSSNPAMNTNLTGTRFYGRPVNALTAREVPLPLSTLPDALKPASGNLTVEGLLWFFKKLPASLQNRIYYNSSSQKLGLRGVLNDRVIGDGDLLATPGAQTILQPNILTDADQATLVALSADTAWTSASTALGTLSRNPKSANLSGSLGVGMEPADVGARYAQQNGPGIAVVTNSDLLDSGTAANLPDNGYLTIAENNDPALGDAPVAIHVIKITREKYRGSVAVIEPENAFDEKVSLQHSGDFGGDVADLVFEWVYREEDGRDLNPPGVTQPTSGTPLPGDWTVFNAPNSGRGQNVIQLAGASSVLITDNVFFCRYRHFNNATGWSAWAGAANSREPKPTSPSAATDAAYVAQLAPGWVKRVTNAVNVFDARIKDFRNNNAPATYTSMIQQAGQRWEGPVAFNPEKDAIEQVGMIELYQTVLDRAEELSIVNAAATTGVGTALLNAANRIAGLYTLLGNEAMADSLDPTVGYSTVGGQFGSLSPTIHAFQNQVGDLLQEELALLRGRGETGARPGYNRLVWNFTNGTGEAAYALNYGISDLTNDGFINDADARRLYPQGHGDAWGHYTMALKGYYDLAVNPNFSWVARSEKFLIDGVVLDVDYLDERAFAKTAASRAQCGTRMVDLTYRQAYTENPNGQWQGYRDVNTDRAWGVVETAQRVGTAAFCDWVLANAMLKEEETDPLKTGIRKVDRQTVGELRLIASEAEAVRTKLAAADAGMNPDGLDPNVVPFDIDPVLTDRTNPNAATHFEQIYNRAVGANQNALQAFNYASEAGKLLRQTAASTEQLRQQTIDQDRSYRNQLIEIFGTPYEGQIGSGKAYPEGYNGPDLYLYMYVEKLTSELNPEVPGNETLLPEFDGTIIPTTITPGIRLLGNDTNPWIPTDGTPPITTPAHGLLKETFNTYFPADFPLPESAGAEIQLELPVQAKDYVFTAPKEWGKRQSPGEFQASIQGLVQAEWRVRELVDQYEGMRDDFHVRLRHFELLSGINGEQINLVRNTNGRISNLNEKAYDAFVSYTSIESVATTIMDLAEGASEAIPENVGLATSAGAPLKGGVLITAGTAANVLRIGSTIAQTAEYRYQIDIDKLERDLDAQLSVGDAKKELMDIAADLQQLANDEVDARQAVVAGLETSRAASERVRTVLQKGIALTEQRMVFNQRVASTTSKQRYEDFTFRIMHHEALRKYQSSFDLASRYAYLAGKAYQYELNLPDNHAANAGPLLSGLLRNRTLGQWQGSTPVINQGGIAESMGVLKANYEVLKGQLGFNNPTSEVNSFSVRAELARVGLGSRVNADWRTKLETWRVPDLWNYQYQSNGVNYGYIYRRYCRPFAPEDAVAQPALVIPFDSTIAAGKNWFGKELAGGDSAFNASNFSTKIRSVGIRLDGFNNTALSQTPQVYLVPVGLDKMFLPDSATLQERSWNVVDQRIPVPLPITGSNLSDPDWRPYTGSASGFFEEIRKFSSFRAYHDAAGYAAQEMLGNGRLVGRSVWNTQWVLIIPSATLLNDPANRSAGIDTLIYGAPLPGFTQTTAGTVNRDLVGIRDLRILLQTYSISGN